jgi:hypothetical protein
MFKQRQRTTPAQRRRPVAVWTGILSAPQSQHLGIGLFVYLGLRWESAAIALPLTVILEVGLLWLKLCHDEIDWETNEEALKEWGALPHDKDNPGLPQPQDRPRT